MDYIPVIALCVTVIGAVWGHAIWLSSKFTGVYKYVDEKFSNMERAITDKLEYHERHDDTRFSELTNSMWEIRLQQAIRNGSIVAKDQKRDKTNSGS